MKAAIIGSGLAGLASAVRLALQGIEVHVFEANAYPGGKLHEFTLQGYRFDAGPSVSTMPWLVDELFELAGKDPRQYFNYRKKELVCRYFYPDGTHITGYSDRMKFCAEVEEKTGVPAKVLNEYLEHSKKNHEVAGKIFLQESLHELGTFMSRNALNGMLRFPQLDITTTLNKVNQKRLQHPKLVQIFNRYATFNGSSPYKAPGILNTIAHLEYNLGTYFIEGGFYSMTRSIYELALELGVQFHFNQKVNRIVVEGKQAKGIEIANSFFASDLVVSNMDVVPSYIKLMPDQKAPKKTINQERSTSMMVFYWGIKSVFPELDLHNAFFTADYEQEFDCLFNKNIISDDPTIYINITSKELPGDAPEGCENWFVMINVPANVGQNWDDLVAATRKNVLAKLSRILGRDIESLIDCEDLLEPRIIESRTSSHTGSIYGASSNNMFAAFLRHANFSKKIKGLYFAGGSVHPGGGTPLCLLSAKIAAERVKKDLRN
jgi:phytoene desaturase